MLIHESRTMRPMQRSHDAASLADLQTAIMEFEKALPGWWYSLGICSVSRDASCGPDIAGPDAALLKIGEFDRGFHCDDGDANSTMADALRNVMAQAIQAKARLLVVINRRAGGDKDGAIEVGSAADYRAGALTRNETERAIVAIPEAAALRNKVFQAITDYWDYLDRHGLINDEKRNLRRARALSVISDIAYDMC